MPNRLDDTHQPITRRRAAASRLRTPLTRRQAPRNPAGSAVQRAASHLLKRRSTASNLGMMVWSPMSTPLGLPLSSLEQNFCTADVSIACMWPSHQHKVMYNMPNRITQNSRSPECLHQDSAVNLRAHGLDLPSSRPHKVCPTSLSPFGDHVAVNRQRKARTFATCVANACAAAPAFPAGILNWHVQQHTCEHHFKQSCTTR